MGILHLALFLSIIYYVLFENSRIGAWTFINVIYYIIKFINYTQSGVCAVLQFQSIVEFYCSKCRSF